MLVCMKTQPGSGTGGNGIIGNPHSGMLSHLELSLLDKAGIAIPTSEVLFYLSLCLPKLIILLSWLNHSRMTKCDNSCLLYTNMALRRSWGILEKICALKNCTYTSPGVYCLVSMLPPLYPLSCVLMMWHEQNFQVEKFYENLWKSSHPCMHVCCFICQFFSKSTVKHWS